MKPQPYTGSEIQPGKNQMTVKGGLKAENFEIVGYTNNIKKGTAKVTLRGVGDYGGCLYTHNRAQESTEDWRWAAGD